MRDLRRYAQQTYTRLLIGGILLFFLIGDGLILVFYGKDAAILGLFCLAIGLAPLALIWLSLSALNWISKRANR